MKYVLAIVVLIGFIALTEAKRRVGLKPSKPPLHCMVKCGTVCTETFACKKDCVRECDQHTGETFFYQVGISRQILWIRGASV